MTVTVTQIKELVLPRFADTVDPDVMDGAVQAAIAYYSRYNPLFATDTLDIVEGQRLYDLPEGFLFLEAFDWWPDGEVRLVGTRGQLWDGAYRQSLAEMRASEVSQFVRSTGSQLVLVRSPTEAETVDFIYCSAHMPDEDNDESYSTVPDADLVILADLVTAEILRQLGTQSALDPDFSEGLMEIRSRDVATNVALCTSMLQAGVKLKYGGY